ncbi:MAG: hypothetical protein PHO27_12645 [Sulfuricurvum sp.]|nr:hypothetical protein [Sulfuricurvum sp.]
MTIVKIIAATLAGIFMMSGCATMNTMKPQSSSKKARIIFEVPANVELSSVNTALKNAIATRSSSLQDNENFIPDVLPDTAGAPASKEIIGGGLMALAGGNPMIASMNTDVSGATYTIKGNKEVGTPFNKLQMAYIGAVYPSKNVTKVYLLVFYEDGNDGMLGALSKATENAIVGGDGALAFTLAIKENFMNAIPSAKITSITPQELNMYKLNAINQMEKK